MTWVCIPCIFSPAEAEDYYLTSSQDTKLWEQLNEKNMPKEFYSQDSLTEACLDFLFGPMSAHSDTTTKPVQVTSTGSEVSGTNLSSRVVSLVSPSVSQDKEKANTTNGTFGSNSHVLFAKWNQDGSCWKTAQPLPNPPKNSIPWLLKKYGKWIFLAKTIHSRTQGDTTVITSKLMDTDTSDMYLGTWPKQGSMRNGLAYLPPMSGPNTYGKDGGLSQNGERFATPTTMDSLPPKSEQALLREMTVARPGRSKPANLRDQVSNMDNWNMFPTPRAQEPCRTTEGYGRGLAELVEGKEQIKLFPTPQTRGFTNDGDLMQLAKVCDNYEEMSAMAYRAAHKKKAGYWPTPLANSANTPSHSKNKQGGENLQSAVAKFPTPVASMYKGSSEASLTRNNGRDRTNDRLDHFVGDTAAARLNPDWVEALMGWIVGWTDITKPCNGQIPLSWGDDWEDDLPRVTSNCPNRAARLRAIGNGQVPLVASTAWQLLMKRFEENI